VDILSLISNLIPRDKIKIIETCPQKINGLHRTDQEINLIYNAMDVYACTSFAEGQCMPIMEAFSTGAIPVAPNDYCMPEIVKEGILVPVKNHVILEAERKFSCVDEQYFVDALNYLYSIRNTEDFIYLQNKNINYSFNFSWNYIGSQLIDIINKTIQEGKDTVITASIFG
jgi:glycosyltransferase involved in cell wall biosynthesis